MVPIGAYGELYVSGGGLSRGYLNRPGLTAEKFIANPFIQGQRMYKTGDLCRWLPDGNIEFIGRNDYQVKIRGYRIELGEIENALQAIAGIDRAVVTAKATGYGEKELIGYLTSKQILDIKSIKSELHQTLPDFMVPAHFVQLDALPVTSNGKLDMKRLPDPEAFGMTNDQNYEAPRNETDEKLVLIWQEILGKERIGINDNFFDVGGNSIKIIRLSNLVSNALNSKIGVALLFQYATIKDLVDHVMQSKTPDIEYEFDQEELLNDLSKFQ
jgi:acyl carrier protein